jgi:putative peptidoglycan lipid II flippase
MAGRRALADRTGADGGAGRRRGGALAVGAGILASRLAGFARAAVTSAAFGVGPHADVLQTALRAPNLLQNLLGEQALSASFIPIYSRLLAAGRHEAARRFAGAVFGLLLAVAGGAALVGVLAARPLVALFAAGYLRDAAAVAAGTLAVDRFELAVTAVRWIFPMTGLLVLSAWALGVLNSHGRFFLAYVAPVVWNAAIIAAFAWGLLSGRRDERLLVAVCIGALVGGLLQFLVQLPTVLRETRGVPVRFSLRPEGVREALAAFGPAVAGRGVVQFSSYLDQLLASLLAVGAVSALGYAQLLYLLPVALFGQSVAAAALPELARSAAAAGSGAESEIARRTRRALGQAGLLNFPTAVAYLVLGPVIVSALYRLLPGRFGEADSWLVGLVLGGYALGLPASTGSRVLQSSFFALSDTRTPARIAALRVAVGTGVALPAMFLLDRRLLVELPGLGGLGGDLRLGSLGLALAASVGAWVEWGLLSRALARRLAHFRVPARERLRLVAASSAGAAAGLAVAAPVFARWPPWLTALAAGAAFLAAFTAASLALGLPSWLAMVRRGRGGGEAT